MFCPDGATYVLSASGSSTRQALTGLDAVCGAVRVYNSGAVGYAAFGDSSITASSSGMSLVNGGVDVFAVPPGATYIAIYSDSSTTAHVTVGHQKG